MSVACFIESDLSLVRLVGEGVDETWRAPAFADGAGGSAVTRMLSRARDAANWTASRLGRSRKLGAVVISVEDALCARVSAPSAARDVLSAALIQREREWTSDTGGTTVQALAQPRRRARRAEENGDAIAPISGRMTVIELHDGPVRLWLDQLDRQGISPDTVETLWNGLAEAWPARAADDHALTAVVLDLDDMAVWSWSRGRELVAAGHAAKPAPEAQSETESSTSSEPSSSPPPRLALDWLAWAAQLGDAPRNLVVVSPDPAPLEDLIRERWPDSRIDARAAADPLGRTLLALARAGAETDDPRRCVVDLTHRPGRAHRWLSYWTVGAILLLATAIAGLGVRQRLAITDARRLTADLQAEIQERVREIDPALAGNPAPARALRSVLVQAREENKPIEAPLAPYPIFDELLLAAGAISMEIADKEDANVRSMKIDELQAEITIAIPDFATGETIFDRLRTSDSRLDWRNTFLGAPPTTQRLLAAWGRGPE